jgi:CheY-like chemotaxis protein
MIDTRGIVGASVKTVVVVNGDGTIMNTLETVLEAGRYDMVFVESTDHAYSNIKRVSPDLVILCTQLYELDGFQLLTMLKLDPNTKDIPVLTYTGDGSEQDPDLAVPQFADDDVLLMPASPAPRMN